MQFTPSEKLKALYSAKIEKIVKKIAACCKFIEKSKCLKLIFFIINSFDSGIVRNKIVSKIKLLYFADNIFRSSIKPRVKKMLCRMSNMIKSLFPIGLISQFINSAGTI